MEIVSSKIETKAVKNILENILKTITTSSTLFEPAVNELLKALKCVLQRQSHVEHLHGITWRQVLSFCVETLSLFLEALPESTAMTTNGSTMRSSNASFRHGSIDRTSKSQLTTHQVDDLVACIRYLYTASNGDFQILSERSIDTLTTYLELVTSYGRSHVDALSAINLILERLSHSCVQLTVDTVKRLMPVLCALWAYKSSQLRDEILKFLVITRLHVGHNQGEIDEDFKSHVSNFIMILRDDYSQRSSREQLHMDDLNLIVLPVDSKLRLPAAYGLTIKAQNFKAESNWTGIYFIAFYSMFMDDLAAKSQLTINETHGGKRARLSTHLEDFMRSCHTSTPQAQICFLQIMAFRVTMQPLSADQLETIISFAMDFSSGSNSSVASWAYLLLAQ